jgi:galactokinase
MWQGIDGRMVAGISPPQYTTQATEELLARQQAVVGTDANPLQSRVAMSLQKEVSREFEKRFGVSPDLIVRAPGRVNLIGEHTDYNDGFVLPMAIDRAIWIALRPRSDDEVRVYSIDFEQSATFSLRAFQHQAEGWVEYLKGVGWALQDAGYTLCGWEGVVGGDVPVGAGLSSSAALELATARAFAAVSALAWDAKEMAKLCQRAENRWIGMNCGIMDQLISAAGQANHALLIDCRSLDTQSVPLPQDTVFVVMDTASRRGLVDSAYNERRAQCEAAARFFSVPALRDVDAERFEDQAGALEQVSRRRARHVVTENVRTLRAVDAMLEGDNAELGRLMDASHVSLRDDFEVSSRELDAMVLCAQQQESCYGARMTGGGFGGCAVALVRAESARAFAATTAACYEASTGLSPQMYVCRATSGAKVLADA